MGDIQRRYLSRPADPVRLVERAAGVGGLPTITGYAAVFYREGDPGTEYELFPADQWGPRVVERMMPSAFTKALAEDDVRALFDHESSIVLGRNKSGTLRLSVDAVGLRYEIDPPDTQAARDLIESLRRGDISGSSFAFLPRNTARRSVAPDSAAGTPGLEVIERHDVQLFDVGPVTYPAYGGATSGLRSAGDAEAARAEVAALRAAADADLIAVAVAELEAADGDADE
jgi:HK97 family phage prohead protease